ncbi:sigma-54-dependent Fis family transcriptional regulator, partial [bacterium]|nr:sigma-54-dependent Fis family transcriptional regulator [bacterium]
YRLNVIPLHMPPLRKMTDDIPLLFDHFLHEISTRKKKIPPVMSSETMDCLTRYNWPGNVRELENLTERLTILNEGTTIKPEDLPERMQGRTGADQISLKAQRLSNDGIDLNAMLDQIENEMIIQALELSNGVKSKAAGLLGLNRTTLIEKLKKKALQTPTPTVKQS